ncbi:MAG TPA: hypothetical protein VEK39_01610 [Solirubrobacterales bacterium]|nr:hypothetical protein [Solirubrobacterales bacterium]
MEPGSPTSAARRAPHPEDGPPNGGFPEPPFGVPIRVVRAAHEVCGAETRVRIPGAIPARAVRRVVCEHCARPFECEAVEDTVDAGGFGWLPSFPDLSGLRPRRPDWLDAPPGRTWRWLSVPLAAAAVIAGLVLIQGSDESTPKAPTAKTAVQAGDAELVRQPGWSLALPDGWQRAAGPTGSAFYAASADGTADVTLWIERDERLSFSEFEARSLVQLRQLAGSASVVERTNGPTLEKSSALLEANAPEGSGASAPYTVTLRASGPYRYYLSTSVEPGAPTSVIEDAKLIHTSFVPEPGEEPTAAGGP